MPKVSAEILIDAPVGKVWEALADFGAIYRWAPAVTNSYTTSENDRGPDAARHCDIAGFGGIEEYVTEWKEGKFFKYKATPVGAIGGSHSTWGVTPKGNKSRVYTDLEFEVRFGPIGALINELIMRRLLKMAMRNTAAGLKHYVETGELVGPGFRPLEAIPAPV